MLKELHDRLLEIKPEGASHDVSSCSVCNGSFVEPEAAQAIPQGGSVKTYTEDEYNALLAQVADLETKVKQLDGVRQESESEARIAELKAQHEAQVSDLQSKFDTQVLEVQAAQDETRAVREYFETLKTQADEAAERDALRSQRIAKVKEVASFPDEYIEARADAWAALDEEAFEAALADWKAIGAKKSDAGETLIPADTALQASRNDQPSPTGTLRDVMRLRFQGVDTRTI